MTKIKTIIIFILICIASWLMGSFAVDFECLPNIIIDTLLKITGGFAILLLMGFILIGWYSIIYEYIEDYYRYKKNRH